MYDYDTTPWINWFNENPEELGKLFVILGPFIALFGLFLFPYICSFLAYLIIFAAIVLFGYAMDWMDARNDYYRVLFYAAFIACILGWVVFKRPWVSLEHFMIY